MKKLWALMSAVLVSAYFPAGKVSAQQEQPMQYRFSKNAMQESMATPGARLNMTQEKPAGVPLPDFQSEKPLFAKWPTPMVKAGFLQIALDGSSPPASYD